MSNLIPRDLADMLDAFPVVYSMPAAAVVRTWREDLASVMEREGDPGPIVAVHPDEAHLDLPFTGTDGPPILVWTAANVYFPVSSGGMELLEVAPRNPI